jgi:hypothetical protein
MRALSPSRTTTGFLGAGAGAVGAFTLFGTPEGESGGSGEQGGVPNGDDPSEATPAGEAQPDKELDFGWELWRQPLSDGGNDWFVWREENGMECINKQGAAQSFSGYVNDAVFFGSRDAAMTAYNTWVKNNGDDGGEKSWDTARQFDEVAGWALFEQAHLTDDKTRYFALSTIESGETVSLLPDGSYRVVPAEEVDGEVRYDTSKVHFYTSRSALVSALEAYMANQSQPNPSQPPVVGGGAAGGVIEGTEGEDGGLVGGLASSPVGIVALLVVLGAGYYIYKTKVK